MNQSLDRLWSEVVLKMWDHHCAFCSQEAVHAHHIFKRRFTALRYDWRNGLAVCASCHEQLERGALKIERHARRPGLDPYFFFMHWVLEHPDMYELHVSLQEHEDTSRKELKDILSRL